MLKSIEELDDFFLSYMPEKGAIGNLRDNRLERMETLLFALKNPEKSYKTIHLAGSKGKGTTATLIAAGLNTSKKTGLYRSPHVYDTRERFTLSGAFFADDEYLESANELSSYLDKLSFSPTTFELYTAYAYLLFKNTGCEYAVIETGLGGRLDATNTIESIMEVILPIELEHTDVLGDTIEKISVEKSKIIKKNSIVILSDVTEKAYRIFEDEARREDAKLYSFRDEISSFSHSEERDGSLTSFSLDGKRYDLKCRIRSYEIGKNYALSILALKRIGELTEDAIKAMTAINIEGRFEERSNGGKTTVLDVAHTAHSMQNLTDTFSRLYDVKKSCVVYSSLSGKDYKSMLGILLEKFDSLIITSAGSFKKSDPDEIYNAAMRMKRNNQMIYLIKNEKEAYSFAKRISDIILITGSFYLVGQFGDENA